MSGLREFEAIVAEPPESTRVYIEVLSRRVEMGIGEVLVRPVGAWFTRNALGADSLPVLVEGMLDTGTEVIFCTARRVKKRHAHVWRGRFRAEPLDAKHPLDGLIALAKSMGAWAEFHEAAAPSIQERPGGVVLYALPLLAFTKKCDAAWRNYPGFRDLRTERELRNIEDYDANVKRATKVVDDLFAAKGGAIDDGEVDDILEKLGEMQRKGARGNGDEVD